MHLLYIDESGKSGFKDPYQPFFILGGLVVHDSTWQALEADLNDRIDALVPPPRSHDWELHMTHMMNGKGFFKHTSRQTREDLAEAVLDVIDAHSPCLIMVAIDKPALAKKYSYPDPPEEIAYRFMIERFDMFLERQDDPRGVIVLDEQKGSEDSIRKAHSAFKRSGTDYRVIKHVIETPFFAPSHWSRMLQIVDVAAWLCNKALREQAAGEAPPEWWTRLLPHLNGYPAHVGKGLKRFP